MTCNSLSSTVSDYRTQGHRVPTPTFPDKARLLILHWTASSSSGDWASCENVMELELEAIVMLLFVVGSSPVFKFPIPKLTLICSPSVDQLSKLTQRLVIGWVMFEILLHLVKMIEGRIRRMPLKLATTAATRSKAAANKSFLLIFFFAVEDLTRLDLARLQYKLDHMQSCCQGL
ncbi:GTP-binding protein HflX [Sesbania bispinosa]|nr:GTP-binding protein HflX [Sesbania bispinosa]